MITSIIKRDGSIEPFNPEKIVIAISKAGSATGEFDTQVSKELVRSMVLPRVNAKKGRAVSVEDVQDIVENVLFDTAFEKTYKAYAIYRNEHTKARERQKVAVDVESSVNEYINQDDWRVRANANQSYSLGGMILNVSGKVTANYWLNSVYPKEIGLAHRNGDFHIHDLDMLSGYCCGHSLRALLNEGFNGVPNKVSSNPPKHLSSALSQAVNFLGTLQNEWAGAQAFSSFDTYLAPFVRVDNLSYDEVKQNVQEFIYNLNVPSRWGCVLPSTKVLTTENKWKGFDELTTKDKVWSINQQGYLCQSAIKVVIKKPYDGLIYELSNDAFNYRQTVTAEHRVYVKNNHLGETINPSPYIVKTAQKIAEDEKEVWVPYSIGASGEETWEDWTSVNEALAGAKPHPPINIQINKISCRHYQGDVWCPSVTEGNVIFKDEEGHVFLSGQTQTPFTNLTFDIHCPDDLRNQHPLIDGKEVDFTYGDLQKEMDMINRAYIEVMIEGDAQGRIFTFPIPTYNITDDFDWDSENSKLMFEMTAKYGTPYFQNFMNSDLDPHMIRSMCPLSADTKVLVRINGTVHRSLIKDIDATEFETFYCGEWHKAKLVKVEPQRKIKVTTSSGDVITFGEHHLQPVYRKDKFETIKVKELKKGDWLPFNKHSYDSEFGSYKLGFAIGAYLGDGSRNGGETGGVTYTIGNKEGSLRTIELLRGFWEELGYRFTVKEEKNIWRINVGGNSFQLLRRFVTGTTALTKGLDGELFRTSKLTRLGVIDGLMMTDGSREKRRLYSFSKKLVEDVRDLVHGLGLKALLNKEDARTTEDGKLSDNVCYCLSLPLRASYGSFFKEAEGFTLYQVADIVEQEVSSDLYCFEVENEEHLFMLANGLITHNCRLRLDLTELIHRGNGLFGSAEQTGSIGVVTINLARLGYLFKGNWEGLLERFDYLCDLAKTSLEIKRKLITKLMGEGLYPFTKRYLGSFKNFFSTIGVNGANEMIRNFSDDQYDITDERGHELAIELLEHLNKRIQNYQAETGNLYNSEATPAEGTATRFAREDRKRFPDIIQAGQDGHRYYTNSTQLPAGFTDDPFEALDHQTDLQRLYLGGTALHLFTGERISSWKAARDIVRKTFSHYQLPYITITPTFSICPKHGYIAGEHKFCPLCDDELVAKKKHEKAKCQKVGIGN